MPKLPRLTAAEAEKLLLQAGFKLIRSREKTLHPKIVKQLFEIIGEEKENL